MKKDRSLHRIAVKFVKNSNLQSFNHFLCRFWHIYKM